MMARNDSLEMGELTDTALYFIVLHLDSQIMGI